MRISVWLDASRRVDMEVTSWELDDEGDGETLLLRDSNDRIRAAFKVWTAIVENSIEVGGQVPAGR